jgi:hypothetical protein
MDMFSITRSKRFEVAVFAALAVLVVTVMGTLLNAGFNVQVLA